jgi:plastocyanin
MDTPRFLNGSDPHAANARLLAQTPTIPRRGGRRSSLRESVTHFPRTSAATTKGVQVTRHSRHSYHRIFGALLIGAALCALLLFPHATPAADGVTIPIANYAFGDGTLTIPAGTTVTWINNDEDGHTTTSDTGLWDSGELASGTTFAFTFADPGTYPYSCLDHPGMVGTIVVTEAG